MYIFKKQPNQIFIPQFVTMSNAHYKFNIHVYRILQRKEYLMVQDFKTCKHAHLQVLKTKCLKSTSKIKDSATTLVFQILISIN